MEVDVAIVGAGPAGSTLAALLARRGQSVALIDRDSFPRDKLCGEFLSYDALPLLEALNIDLGDAPTITGCRVISRHRAYEFDFPHAARGISRSLLDATLFRAAVRAGATPIEHSAAIRISRASVALEDGEIRARLVVGAWGRWGRFDAQLQRAFVTDRSHRNFGFKRHYRGRRPATGDRNDIELYSFDRGYLGVSPIEEGESNICGLVHASRLSGHKGRWDAFVDTIRRDEPTLEAMYSRFEPAQEGFLSSEPVIFRPRSPVEEGIFMIGDASGIIDPLTGNGMAMAMQSAFLAAPFVVRALASDVESEYCERHHQFFGTRIAWSRRVAWLLSRPAMLDAVLRARPSAAAGRFFLRRTRADDDEIARLAASSS